MSTLYKAPDRFKSTYFEKYPVQNRKKSKSNKFVFLKEIRLFFYQGYYDTMDAGVKDEHGYIEVLAREDDVINVAGHRQGIFPCYIFTN